MTRNGWMGTIGLLTLASPVTAQDTSQAPMRALARALAVIAPASGSPPRTLAQLRALPSGIRWLAKPVRVDRTGTLRVGSLAGAEVTVSGPGVVRSIGFDWGNLPGHPLGFDPIKALKARGFRVRTALCQNDGMVSEIWRWYETTLPGRQVGVFYLHAFDAPTGASSVSWTMTYDLTGRRATLAEARAELNDIATDQCEQE